MNNKGFTLAELLAIVVILSVIMVLAAPNLGKQIQKNEENTNTVLKTKIENASKLYIAKYYAKKVIDNIDKSGSNVIASFTLDDLQRDGLLSLKGNDGCKGSDGKTLTGTIDVSAGSGRIDYNYNNITNDGKCYN